MFLNDFTPYFFTGTLTRGRLSTIQSWQRCEAKLTLGNLQTAVTKAT
jgi:hypothetical protein